MALTFFGTPFNINEVIVGRYTIEYINRTPSSYIIDYRFLNTSIPYNYLAAVSNTPLQDRFPALLPYLLFTNEFPMLNEGDIIALYPSGMLEVLFDIKSTHNAIFITNACNCNCLMCSQPPQKHESYLYDINKQLVELVPDNTESIGITGGEPLLRRNDLICILQRLQQRIPEIEVDILTNGRLINKSLIEDLKQLNKDKIIWSIPLHSDNEVIHDYITGVSGSFSQTMAGVYLLAQNNCRIEIRIILQKLTVSRLIELAKFLTYNLPFAERIIFMGLESIGNAQKYFDKVYAQSFHYIHDLVYAMKYLRNNRHAVSLFNLQLCLLPTELWEYASKSISEWKNYYLSECNNCAVKNDCCGFFTSDLSHNYEVFFNISNKD